MLLSRRKRNCRRKSPAANQGPGSTWRQVRLWTRALHVTTHSSGEAGTGIMGNDNLDILKLLKRNKEPRYPEPTLGTSQPEVSPSPKRGSCLDHEAVRGPEDGPGLGRIQGKACHGQSSAEQKGPEREAESSLSLKLVGFSKGSHQNDSQQATNPETHGSRGRCGSGAAPYLLKFSWTRLVFM